MSRLALAVLAIPMLAGCGAGDSGATGSGENAAIAPSTTTNGAAAADSGDLAARAQVALSRALGTATSQTSALRATPSGAICGTVSYRLPQGGDSGPRPFLVSPQGEALVSAAPRVMVEDPADSFVDAYMRWCASVEELRAMQAQLSNTNAAAVPDLPPLPADSPPPLLLDPEEPSPIPPAPPRTRWAPANPPPPANQTAGDRDSFSNAVLRPPRQ